MKISTCVAVGLSVLFCFAVQNALADVIVPLDGVSQDSTFEGLSGGGSGGVGAWSAGAGDDNGLRSFLGGGMESNTALITDGGGGLVQAKYELSVPIEANEEYSLEALFGFYNSYQTGELTATLEIGTINAGVFTSLHSEMFSATPTSSGDLGTGASHSIGEGAGSVFQTSFITPGTVSGDNLAVQITAAGGAYPGFDNAIAGFSGGIAPDVLEQPEDQFLVLGDTDAVVTFSAVVAGTRPLMYQWDKGGIAIPGATNDSLVIADATPADVGIYTLSVANSLGADASDPADLLLVTAPVVPSSLVLLGGDTASFSVTMPEDSAGYLYQWKHNGGDIGGATDATLEVTGLTAGDSGDYTVTVTLGADSATSDPASLTVVPLPSSSYDSLVSSDNPLIWWRLGESAGATTAVDEIGPNDADILIDTVVGESGALLGDTDTAAHFPGTADSKVELVDSLDAQTAQFTVEFWALSSGGGGFRSPVTMRSVDTGLSWGWSFYATAANEWLFEIYDGTAVGNSIAGPSVVQGAWTHVVGTYDGMDMKLYVDGALAGTVPNASYDPDVGYMPLWIGASGTEDVALVGHSFWIGKVDEVALYDRALTAMEVVDHWAAAFQPGSAPEISGDPQPISAFAGDDASFTVAARGTPLLQYQWKKDGIDIPGATEPTLLLTDVAVADAGFYSAIVSNSGGSVTSSAAELLVLDALDTIPPLDGESQDSTFEGLSGGGGGGVGAWTAGAGDDNGLRTFLGGGLESNTALITEGAGGLVQAKYDLGVPIVADEEYGLQALFGYYNSFQGAELTATLEIGTITAGVFTSLHSEAFSATPTSIGAAGTGASHSIGEGAGSVFLTSYTTPSSVSGDSLAVQITAAGGSYPGFDDVIVTGPASALPATMMIGLQGGQVLISWDGSGVLQQSEDLARETWDDVPGAPSSPYSETTPVDNRSFRLREP